MQKNGKKVFVAMSGGVDSSVAAFLLKNRGYDVVGVFMRCYNLDGCAERDAEDGRRVAEKLGIPFYAWNFEKEYKKKVVDYMIDGYKKGITPNPDVMCNREIKFGLFLDKALALGADFVATGHYVKLKNGKLFEADDKNKDQSYFLWTLTPSELRRCLFPIGDYLKPEVREIARNAGLPPADKKDSQGICFLGKITLSDFLKKHIRSRLGDVIIVSGKKIGEHDGAHFYTIGQRHINIAKRKAQSANNFGITAPLYVVEKNVKKNVLVVAEGENNPALYKKEIALADVNLISPHRSHIHTNVRMSVWARVRYRQPLASATLIYADETQTDADSQRKSLPAGRQAHNGPRYSATLIFERGQKFVAPGQSVVFYGKNGEMFGGGVIV